MEETLRFATPEETAEAERRNGPPTGYIQQQHDNYPPSQAQLDALEHPEDWYCGSCGASFASHSQYGCTH